MEDRSNDVLAIVLDGLKDCDCDLVREINRRYDGYGCEKDRNFCLRSQSETIDDVWPVDQRNS